MINSIDLLMKDIRKTQVLPKEEQWELARRWQEENDKEALEKLIVTNLRFSMQMAHKYKFYNNVDFEDLVSSSYIGIVEAAKRFDHKLKLSFTTYALHWIRSNIYNTVIRGNYVIRKFGTTAASRALFFKIKKVSFIIAAPEEEKDKLREQLASEVRSPSTKITIKDVKEFETRLQSREFSIDVPATAQTDGSTKPVEGSTGFSNYLRYEPTVDEDINHNDRRDMIIDAMKELKERERQVLTMRYLSSKDEVQTLNNIGKHFGISRERVRQIEASAIKKLKVALQISQEN